MYGYAIVYMLKVLKNLRLRDLINLIYLCIGCELIELGLGTVSIRYHPTPSGWGQEEYWWFVKRIIILVKSSSVFNDPWTYVSIRIGCWSNVWHKCENSSKGIIQLKSSAIVGWHLTSRESVIQLWSFLLRGLIHGHMYIIMHYYAC